MNYFEAFNELKETLQKANIKKGDGHFAIQVCITDTDAGGIFYIEDFGDKIIAEPYDYYDNDAEILGQARYLKSLFEKKLALEKAIENGNIVVNGNIDAVSGLLKRITKTTVKRVSTAKATAKKSGVKKTEVTKMADDTKNKDNKNKDSETIKEVVEKEIKPKK